MISSYRLGDLVVQNLSLEEENEILKDHPNSMGAEFIKEKRKKNTTLNLMDKLKIFLGIINKYLKNNVEKFPKDIIKSTVIHLRLGDVVAGNEWHEIMKRPLDKDYLKEKLKDDKNKKYIIGCSFFAKTSSTNIDECVNKSEEYLKEIIEEFQAEHFNSKDADLDLCFSILADNFLQGRGYFSMLICMIRKVLGKKNILTLSHIRK